MTQRHAAPPSLDALRNAEYDGRRLDDGRYRDLEAPLEVHVLDSPVAFGDLDGDAVDDAVAVLVTTHEGSAGLVSIVAVVNDDGTPHHCPTFFIGDRTAVDSLSIEAGVIHASGKRHQEGDPLCCPTEEITWTLALRGRRLVEL